uniref:Uncharacterized protein n=1 Tax=Lygus hesperus TaxID=30085 RepID=A0A0A9X2P3_LYGHE
MAAPHIDNPFGAKPDSGGGPSATDVNKNKVGNKDGNKANKDKNAKDNKGVGVPAYDGPRCAHPYCNDPSDPSDYPIGLPWASGLLKCLPGYCKKHRKEAIDNLLEGAEEELDDEEGTDGKRRDKKVCKCKEDTSVVCTHKPDDKPPYKKFIYADDPTVGSELCFFLRMMMVGDEMDRGDEEERKAEREAAKKKKEKKKKKKGVDATDKGGSKGKKKKVDQGSKSRSNPNIPKEKSKTSQKTNEPAPAPGGEDAPVKEDEATAPTAEEPPAAPGDEGEPAGPEAEPQP